MISQAVKLGSDGLLIRLSLMLQVHFLLYLGKNNALTPIDVLIKNTRTPS